MSNTRTRKDYINQLEREISGISAGVAELKKEVNCAEALASNIFADRDNAANLEAAKDETKHDTTQNGNRLQRLLANGGTGNKVPPTKARTHQVSLIPAVNTKQIMADADRKRMEDEKDPTFIARKQAEDAKKLEIKQQLDIEEKKLEEKKTELAKANSNMENDVYNLFTVCKTYKNHLTESTCCWIALNVFMIGMPAFFHLIFYSENKSTKLDPQNQLQQTLTGNETDAEKLDLFEETMQSSAKALSPRRARSGFSFVYDSIVTLFGYAPGQSQGKDFCDNAEAVLAKTRRPTTN